MVHTHILLLIFPGQGAINPALQLAKNLTEIGVQVTLATTVSAHRRMITKTSPTLEGLEGLTIVTFSDGYDDGLKDVQDIDQFLSELKNRGSQAVVEIIGASAKDGQPVTCLVYTMLQPWAAKVAHTFHIPSAVLWTQPATVFDIYYYYFNGYGDNIRKISYDYASSSIGLPFLPQLTSRDLPSFMVPSNSNYYKFALPGFEEQLDTLAKGKTKILVNTFDALEPEALRAIEKVNLAAIGPLVPSTFLNGKDPFDPSVVRDHFGKSRHYVEWLDLKARSSVVYVSFGSMAVLSKRQMEEIARGLLDCHRPFLWVIRDTENGEKHEDHKLSFMEELEQLGMIVPWCSQVGVLAHPSLGCFFTHCGWNSTLESLVSGVPMVSFPQFTDQLTNAKLIEDVFRTGVRVTVDEEGIVEGDEIKRCIEVVMGGGEFGEELKRNAKKWKDLAKEALTVGGSSDMNLRTFVEEVEADFSL